LQIFLGNSFLHAAGSAKGCFGLQMKQMKNETSFLGNPTYFFAKSCGSLQNDQAQQPACLINPPTPLLPSGGKKFGLVMCCDH
jgi:hypothetical protein